MKKAALDLELHSIKASINTLRAEVNELQRLRRLDTHQHDWLYAKKRIGSANSFGGPSWLWTWECRADHICLQGQNSTNSLADLPDHFPVELR